MLLIAALCLHVLRFIAVHYHTHLCVIYDQPVTASHIPLLCGDAGGSRGQIHDASGLSVMSHSCEHEERLDRIHLLIMIKFKTNV